MMWSLGKVIKTPEVVRVYLGSFWAEPPPSRYDDCRELLEAEQRDLLDDLEELPRNAAVRKINEIIKRARTAKVEVDGEVGQEGKDDMMSEILPSFLTSPHSIPSHPIPSSSPFMIHTSLQSYFMILGACLHHLLLKKGNAYHVWEGKEAGKARFKP